MICNWRHLTGSNMPIYAQSERITKEVCKKKGCIQQKFKVIILEVLMDQ
jgi:hypothetical protein